MSQWRSYDEPRLANLCVGVGHVRSTDSHIRQSRCVAGQFESGHFSAHHHHPAGDGCAGLAPWRMAATGSAISQGHGFFGAVGCGHRRVMALLLPCFATGARLSSRAHRQAQRRLCGDLRCAVSRRTVDLKTAGGVSLITAGALLLAV